jgi:twitching motility protein PilT
MVLDPLVRLARERGASDLHLEPGLPAALRIQGRLELAGEPLAAETLLRAARELLPGEDWEAFSSRRSADVARAIQGARCRINAFCTARGVGFAIRLLAPFQASIDRLNLHPDLKKLVQARHGLVIVSGPTGSGKSSTLAALVEEVNRTERRHVVTVESPIEFSLVPRLAFIRQREVGRDTPSFDQALRDALREDSDLLVVGEVRDPEAMRLTLSAAETGHLVLTTLHSSTVGDALARVVSAFPAEIQPGVCAQLADSLVAVVCQRMRWWPARQASAPECELLVATTQVRALVRQGQFFKLSSALETGGHEGCWTFARYREWMERRTDWYTWPTSSSPDAAEDAAGELPAAAPTPAPAAAAPEPPRAASRPGARPARPAAGSTPAAPPAPASAEDRVFSIDDADENLEGILSELDRHRPR